jgi:hypothetical protein
MLVGIAGKKMISPDVQRQRESYEKNKASALTKGKDWSTPIVISLISIVISVVTFVSTMFVRDDLRVVIGASPTLNWDEETGISISGTQEFTFINSGGRAAAITLVSAGTRRIKDDSLEDACVDRGKLGEFFYVNFGIKPFIVEPGQIRIFDNEVSPDSWFAPKTENGGLLVSKKLIDMKENDKVLVCLRLNVIIADNVMDQWRHPVFILSAKDGILEMEPLFVATKPILIITKIRPIFAPDLY